MHEQTTIDIHEKEIKICENIVNIAEFIPAVFIWLNCWHTVE